ncbi:MAG: amidase [Ferrovibrio sp.]|uniref:amidase n=1 Tax=Ferrovibrio sp. TaxID=1917215 RepID=UPI003919B4FF
MTDLHDLTAHDLWMGYRTGRLSPVEATRAALKRIALWEPKINAMYIIDEAGALAQARASEQRWRKGAALSPLDGVPITLKENIASKGVPTPVGTAAAILAPSAVDAPPAARVREAGCVILGKTTMPDFGMLASGVSSLHGTTRNPWNLKRNTAGSSSGAGAAIAAGYGPLALGTDIGGSVRLPAAYNGIFALKPSLGRIPIHPPYLGRVTGPMTRTVMDSALLMNHLTRPDGRDYMSLPYEDLDYPKLLDGEVKGLKIGLLLDAGLGIPVQPAVKDAVQRAARLFEAAGAIIEPVKPFMTQAMADGLNTFFQSRAYADFAAMPPERQARVLPYIATWCRAAAGYTAVDVMRALGQVFSLREATIAATLPYDYVLTPTSPITAYDAEEAAPGNDPQFKSEHIRFTAPFNQSEQPASSICAGYDAEGLPIGLQIVGRRFDDAGVLRLSRIYEQMRPALRPWPEP